MGWTCRTHVYNTSVGNVKGSEHVRDLGPGLEIILTLRLKGQGVKLCIRVGWLRIGSDGGVLWTRQ
jgi:hypothetical protein